METTELLSPVKAARREKILDAAQHLFVKQGVKATTMEGIATAVGMSKATVYSYFSDKDAVFVAVAYRFFDGLKETLEGILYGKGTLQDRIGNALVAKFEICYGGFRSSPFADEIFSTRYELVGDMGADAYQLLQSLISCAYRRDGVPVARAHASARLLAHAAYGISENSDSFDETVCDLRRLADACVGNAV